MGEEHRIIIPGELKKVREACDFVVAAAGRAGLNENAIHHCQMAVDEACTNIIEHGYLAANRHGEVEIICQNDRDRFSIRILDDSSPFDPLGRDDPDPSAGLFERSRGGWGIYFIKKMTDEVGYVLLNGRNQLTIVKYKTPENLEVPLPPTAEAVVPVRALSDHAREILPSGRLDSTTSPDLQEALNTQLASGITLFVVNLSQVSYISTSGMKVLVNTWRTVREQNGNLLLVGMNPHVAEVFEVVGFDQLFDIYDTLDEAVQTLGNKSG